MRASLTLDQRGLQQLIRQIDDPLIRSEIMQIPQKKAVAALVGEAIADNFAKEGPGWKAVKPSTIRRSVSKKAWKLSQKLGVAARQILDVSGVLKKTVTTPGVRGNIWQVDGTKLVWGTDLIYAGIHNHGGVINHPGTNRGFGIKGLKIPPHQIRMPKREFLTIRAEWMKRLTDYVAEQAFKTIVGKAFKGVIR